MTLKNLATLLERRKNDIQRRLDEVSGIYSTKSVTSGSMSSSAMSLSTEDRLRLFALENERLRQSLKSLNEQIENELSLINSALLELNQGNDDNRRLTLELERIKELNRILEAQLVGKELEHTTLNHTVTRLEEMLNKEKARNSDLQIRVDYLNKELDSTKTQRASGDMDQLYKQKIAQLERSLKELKDEKDALKTENMRLEFRLQDLSRATETPIKLDLKKNETFNNGDVSEKKIIDAIGIVRDEMRNFTKAQHEVLEKIKDDKERRSPALSQEFDAGHGRHINFSGQRSWGKHHAQHGEREPIDPHLDLSLNLPAEYDFDGTKGSDLKKMKQVIKMLKEKFDQSQKTLDEKTAKLKELKKENKEMVRELDVLKSDQRIHKADESKLEDKLKKTKDELDRIRNERDRALESQTALQKKLDKQEKKMRDLKETEQKIQSLEKQKEMMLLTNRDRDVEIQSLKNALHDKDNALNQVMSMSQLNPEASQYDDSATGLRTKYLKLKRLFLGLREAYFRLQDEYTALAAAVEKEVKMRESILEDFLKRSDFFEEKIGEFRDFPDQILNVKRLIINKQVNRQFEH